MRKKFFFDLAASLNAVEVESGGFEETVRLVKNTKDQGRVYFIGNGGSAAIASHMAVDFLNKGNLAAQCFNDLAALTCLANDYGYENVFDQQIKRFAHFGDVLFAISSSGNSANIMRAAHNSGCVVITLSGFKPENKLRSVGLVNFYVPSHSYGIVETAHLGILHSILEEVAAE